MNHQACFWLSGAEFQQPVKLWAKYDFAHDQEPNLFSVTYRLICQQQTRPTFY